MLLVVVLCCIAVVVVGYKQDIQQRKYGRERASERDIERRRYNTVERVARCTERGKKKREYS